MIRILMTFFRPILPALTCVSFSLLTLQHPRATSWPSPPLWEASHVIFRSLTLPYKSRLLATSRGRKVCSDKAIFINPPCTILLNQPPAAAPPCPLRRTSPKGKHVTGFSVAYGSLRIQFLCHPASGGRTTRAKQRETYFYGSSLPIKKDRRRPVFFDAPFIGVRSCSLL